MVLQSVLYLYKAFSDGCSHLYQDLKVANGFINVA